MVLHGGKSCGFKIDATIEKAPSGHFFLALSCFRDRSAFINSVLTSVVINLYDSRTLKVEFAPPLFLHSPSAEILP